MYKNKTNQLEKNYICAHAYYFIHVLFQKRDLSVLIFNHQYHRRDIIKDYSDLMGFSVTGKILAARYFSLSNYCFIIENV